MLGWNKYAACEAGVCTRIGYLQGVTVSITNSTRSRNNRRGDT